MRSMLDSFGYSSWILTALLVIPVLGAIAIWIYSALLDRDDEPSMDGGRRTIRLIALLTLVIEFVVSLGLWWSFDPSIASWQAVADRPWIDAWGARYIVGIDGISLMMVLLTTLIMPLAV